MPESQQHSTHLPSSSVTSTQRFGLVPAPTAHWANGCPPPSRAPPPQNRPPLPTRSVIDLSKQQLTAVLEETTLAGNSQLSSALFSHADAVSQVGAGRHPRPCRPCPRPRASLSRAAGMPPPSPSHRCIASQSIFGDQVFNRGIVEFSNV
jgi:hypothetical protein